MTISDCTINAGVGVDVADALGRLADAMRVTAEAFKAHTPQTGISITQAPPE